MLLPRVHSPQATRVHSPQALLAGLLQPASYAFTPTLALSLVSATLIHRSEPP